MRRNDPELQKFSLVRRSAAQRHTGPMHVPASECEFHGPDMQVWRSPQCERNAGVAGTPGGIAPESQGWEHSSAGVGQPTPEVGARATYI